MKTVALIAHGNKMRELADKIIFNKQRVVWDVSVI
jgi:hypothetical protein